MCFSWSGPWRSVNHIVSVFDAAKENLALLLRRVKDSKTNVRKAALQVPGAELNQQQPRFRLKSFLVGGRVEYLHVPSLTCVLFLHRPCWVSWNMTWSPWVGRLFRLCQSAAETHLCLWKRRPCSVWGTCSVWVEPHADGTVTEVTVGEI